MNVEKNDHLKSERKAFEFINHYEELINVNDNIRFLEFDNELERIFKESKITIEKNNLFFRSRIYYEDDAFEKSKMKKSKNSFNGYSKDGSFVKLFDIKSERMNKENEACLYMSSDKEFTLREIDAAYNDYISVAIIKNKEELIVADLSMMSAMSSSHYNCMLSIYIQNKICKNYKNNNYKFSQYVASRCKEMKYDGIAYKSKYSNYTNPKLYNRGINYAIFNYDKCEAICSNVYSCIDNQTRLFDDYTNKIVNLSRNKRRFHY